MAQKLLLQHPETKKIKDGVVGFSWTMLLFQLFVPLFRRDWKIFFPLLLVSMAVAVPQLNFYYMVVSQGTQNSLSAVSVADPLWALFNSAWTLFVSVGGAFFYNGIYTRGLVKKGWRPLTQTDEALLQKYNIKVPADYELHSVSKMD